MSVEPSGSFNQVSLQSHATENGTTPLETSPAGICDVVVPVHGSFDAVDDCLRSVLEYTPLLSRLIVVDDASDRQVASWLDAFAREHSLRVCVVRHESNRGFVHACNHGIEESSAPFVCLLNSDTIVTPGWLDAMVRCARADSKIAVVNPLSNAAVNLSVQLAPGLDVFTMAESVAAYSRHVDPDVVTAVGFCFLVTREAIERFGGFDEMYGEGYCEESDYCMRVTGAGMRVVVADDAFVFHRGGASFGRSRERYLRNRQIFDSRWAERYEKEHNAFMMRDPLGYMRAALESGLDVSSGSSTMWEGHAERTVMGKFWAMTLDAWSKGGPLELTRKIPAAFQHLGGLARSLTVRGPGSETARLRGRPPFQDPEQRRRSFATPEYVSRLPRGRGLRIGVLVWQFDLCGGVLAIVELVNQLVLAGHTVVLATLDDRGIDAAFTLYARPLIFRSVEDLAEGLSDVDVVMATFWLTALEWLPVLRRRKKVPAVYFVQDYESWFIPEDEPARRARVIESYGAADVLVVTTAWLQEKVREHGHHAVVIPCGIDTRVFYPRGDGTASRRLSTASKRILVLARPDAPWRGFREAVVVLDRLLRRRTDVTVVFFGCTDEVLRAYAIPFPFTNAGAVFDRHAVARLYSESDVLFDPSVYQAFGLPGLEAMACGVPAVLPRQGGIGEYAQHEWNALLVDSGDPDGRVAAIERVLDEIALRVRLVENGLTTSERFRLQEMARRHLAVLLDLQSPGVA